MDDHSPYSLVSAAPLLPGTDWVTKSPNGPLIDTGVDIKFNERGRLYLSVETLREMAEVAGLFDVAPVDNAADLAEQYELGRNAGIKEDINGRVGNIVDQLVSCAAVLRDAGIFVGPVPEDVDSAASSNGHGDLDANADAGVADGSPKPDYRPAGKRRRNDVPAASGDSALRV